MFNLGLGDRLVSERRRLGLHQTQVSEQLGISVVTLSNYENGKRVPDVAMLATMAKLGYDVGYLLWARRESQGDGLSDDEAAWLALYHALSDDDRVRVRTMVQALAAS